MSPTPGISRREAVRRLTVLLGTTLSSSTVTALLSGCRAVRPDADWAPEALSADHLEILTAVVDTILPRTDTPGAVDVGVPAFIDRLLARWAEDDARARVLSGLDELGPAFLAGDADARTTRLVALDEAAAQAREDEVDPLPYFATLKEWTLAGYYTSEAGATEELRWLAVPGRYDADVPLSDVGRTWA